MQPPPKAPTPKNLGKRRRRRRRNPKKVNKKLLTQFVDKHLSLYKEKMEDLEKLKKKYTEPILIMDFRNEEMLAHFSYIISFIGETAMYTNLLLVCRRFFEILSRPNKNIGHYNYAAHHSENVDFFLCSKPRSKSRYVRRLFIVKDYIIFKRFRFLKLFSNLQHLEIKHQYYFTGEELKYVKNLSSLAVKVCDTFNGKPLSTNTKLISNLRSLEISENDKVEDSFFSQFCSLENLRIVKCKRVTKEAIENLTRLRKLKITHCNKIENESFLKLQNVNQLMLKWCHNITGRVIGKNLLHLTELVLWNMDRVTDDIFTSHPDFNRHLTKLGIKFCRLIEGKNIPNNFTRLKELRLVTNEKLCDELLFKCYENLEYLEIRKCKEITDEPFLIEERPFSKLVVVKIWGLNKVTDKMFMYLNELRLLEIEYCRGIGTYATKKKKMKFTSPDIINLPSEDEEEDEADEEESEEEQAKNYYKHLTKLNTLTLKEGFSSNTIRFFSNLSDSMLFGPWFSDSLRVLKLGCTKKINGDGFVHLKRLEKLQIVDLDEIDDSKIGHLKNIRELEVKRCKRITFRYDEEEEPEQQEQQQQEEDDDDDDDDDDEKKKKKKKRRKKKKKKKKNGTRSPVFDLECLLSVKIKSCMNVKKGDLRKLKRKLKKNKKEMKKKQKKNKMMSKHDGEMMQVVDEEEET